MLPTPLYSNKFIINLLKIKLLMWVLGRNGHKVISMSSHLKKDVGLCTEEREIPHYSRYL